MIPLTSIIIGIITVIGILGLGSLLTYVLKNKITLVVQKNNPQKNNPQKNDLPKTNLQLNPKVKTVYPPQKISKKHAKHSKYHGVSFTGGQKTPWRVRLSYDFKQLELGRYTTERAAARAYDEKAFECLGAKAKLNFPEKYGMANQDNIKIKNNTPKIVLPPNQKNINKNTGYSSKFRGVCYHKLTQKWQASILQNSKNKYLGQYTTEEEAAKAYDKEAKTIYGISAIVNFPETPQVFLQPLLFNDIDMLNFHGNSPQNSLHGIIEELRTKKKLTTKHRKIAFFNFINFIFGI
jgi:hypothetical protein